LEVQPGFPEYLEDLNEHEQRGVSFGHIDHKLCGTECFHLTPGVTTAHPLLLSGQNSTVPQLGQNITVLRIGLCLKDKSGCMAIGKRDGRRRSKIVKESTNNFPFRMVPSIRLDAIVSKFLFTPPSVEFGGGNVTKKDLVDTFIITNNSSAKVQRELVVSETITDEYDFGFEEKLRVMASVSVKVTAKIPGVADVETEGKIEVEGTFTNHEEWKHTKEKKLQLSYLVEVPQFSSVVISAYYEKVEDLTLEYTAEMEVRGTAEGLTQDYDIIADRPITSAQISEQWNHLGINGDIINATETTIVVELTGTMTASIGIKGVIGVTGAPLDHRSAAAATSSYNRTIRIF